ncbi:2OG-Fe(II) oxygenase [Chitinophagaceae bacterium MMS25-I14]
MDHPSLIQHLLPQNEFTCFVIPRLFSADECAFLLTDEIKQSFQQAISNYPVYYRNNDRFVTDDEKLAAWLLEKVRPFLPEEITEQKSGCTEVWKLENLNPRIRYCRYAAHQYFHRHLDGVHYEAAEVQSKLTFMLYLNDATEFEGGRTLFFRDKDTTEIWAAYTPVQGDLIVFDHNIWHEGEMLQSGTKYVLRSDLLYRREARTDVKTLPFSGHLGYIWKLCAFNENTLLSGGRDKGVRVWNETGTLMQTLYGHEHSVLCLEKLNHQMFISGSRDRHIKIWKQNDHGAFSLCNDVVHHTAVVLDICRLTDNTFASCGADNVIQIADINGTVKHTLGGHTGWVWQLLRYNDDILCSCSEDGTVRIWDYNAGTAVRVSKKDQPLFCIAKNPSGTLLAAGNLVGEIVLFFVHEEMQLQEVARIPAHTGIVRTLLFVDDDTLASGGEDNKVRLWDINSAAVIDSFSHENFVQSLVMWQGKLLSASYDGTIKGWAI